VRDCYRYLGILFLMVFLIGLATEGVASKPTSPVSVNIELLERNESQDQQRYVVKRMSRLTAKTAELTVELPEGVVLTAGTISWRGAIEGGEVKQIKFFIQAPKGSNGVIKVVAVLLENKSIQYAASASHALGVEVVRANKSSLPMARRTKRHGDSVVEYHLPKILVQ